MAAGLRSSSVSVQAAGVSATAAKTTRASESIAMCSASLTLDSAHGDGNGNGSRKRSGRKLVEVPKNPGEKLERRSFDRVSRSSSQAVQSPRTRSCQGGGQQRSSRPRSCREGGDMDSRSSSQVLDLISSTAASSSSRPWWSPLFDLSGNAYSFGDDEEIHSEIEAASTPAPSTPAPAPSSTREPPLDPAEKFKLLRARLSESESWHDTMYHSAIASRLATKIDGTDHRTTSIEQ